MLFRGACYLILLLGVLSSGGNRALGQVVDPAPTGPDQPDFEAQEMQPTRRKSDSEPYAPLALRAGVFDFHPAIEMEAVYSDNPGQISSGARPAAGIRLAPELALKSDWVRHAFRLKASGERIDYADQPEQATMEGEVESSLIVDIRRNTTAEVTLAAAKSQTNSGSSEVPDNAAAKRND